MKSQLRVVAHESVVNGFCLLVASDGRLLYAGPLGECSPDFPPQAVWYLSPEDSRNLEQQYDSFMKAQGLHATTDTLQ